MKFVRAPAFLLATAGLAGAFVVPSSRSYRTVKVGSTITAPEIETAVSTPSPSVEEEAAEKVELSSSLDSSATESSTNGATETILTTPDLGDKIIPGRYDETTKSAAFPFLPRPTNLDGSHAGDFGFDPMGLSVENDLYTMQEAEIRHARLAMLAVVGWPMSELVAPNFMLQEHGLAPSVLNGVNPITFAAIVASLAGFGFFEYKTALRRTADTKLGKIHRDDMSEVWEYGVAGDYNFDPLDLYSSLGDDARGRKGLRELEITQGRLAMVGITYFALWESLTHTPVVANNPFFHPNPVLPLAAVGYGVWSQIYKISDVTKYPIKLEYTSDGEVYLQKIQDALGSAGDAVPDGPSIPVPQPTEEQLTMVKDAATSAVSAMGGAVKSIKDWTEKNQ
uniref:Plastid light harvesting protein n=1 Tax=Grammatophora oceanica TaxID=210454 RepID=A0A7S1Y7I5_9STRA|mmetsp:Transcript_28206/g.41524  ORF Transcript_28206/g.41524 Transcript_28206/m.41524 type:complete len:394 (+) Transcript_28206:66-1247(+)|eukprot:CAMPEP_0194026900 /NCGR_PEP_ID=MMETSP0009_2-20130614/1145_1 /TAXON_ID=210454 /ORGANISM="Grammatophora oceanica, Strain CCMP 410" /LENGTH=393 /DNA_ID=CAMNT_0038665787 /DNA_START=65 /DNA_END=1246 /DNA_ORIENTATION=-